jgi:hypothetical protein
VAASPSPDADWLAQILAFLSSIEIVTQPCEVPPECFLPGVCIARGHLQYDASKLVAPSDLLHEAGHIAVTPSIYRSQLDGTLSPELACEYGGEIEAIAWSFAAATAIGLPLAELFHPLGYRGQAPGLAFNFSLGVYPGAHGLIRAGLATDARIGTPGAYPALQRWLRE